MNKALRIVVVAPDLAVEVQSDIPAMGDAEQLAQLRQELAATKTELGELSTALRDRKVIDRAKGLLMQHQGLSEPAAYAKLRTAAMNKNLKLVDVAQRMLDVADLLG